MAAPKPGKKDPSPEQLARMAASQERDARRRAQLAARGEKQAAIAARIYAAWAEGKDAGKPLGYQKPRKKKTDDSTRDLFF